MGSKVYIYEDETWEDLLPLTYLHPVFELVCGMWSTIERFERIYGDVVPISRMHKNERSSGLYINGRAIFYERIEPDGEDEIFRCKDEIVAFRTRDGMLPNEAKTRQVHATIIKYPWDLIRMNREILLRDFEYGNFSCKYPNTVSIDGNPDYCVINEDVKVYRAVYLVTEGGPIYVDRDAQLRPQSVIYGPAYIGKGAIIDGAKIREGCSIGKGCKVGGEVEESIFLPFSNKHHEGFVGHSYIGEWVNLGALTTTSDLKNTYGNIRVSLPGGNIDTNLVKFGSVIGDHTKTGIGTLLTTGCILGVFCNLYGGGTFSKYIESFSWGTKDDLTLYRLDKAIETAKKVMKRRGVEPPEDYIERISRLFHKISSR